MDIVLKSVVLPSGNAQVHFQIDGGEYKGVYGYLLAPEHISYKEIEEKIRQHLNSDQFNYYPFSTIKHRVQERPVFINSI